MEVPHQGVRKMSIAFGDSLNRQGAGQLLMEEGR
jgi:hypothetical protein